MNFFKGRVFAALMANLFVLVPLVGWAVGLLFWPLDRLMRAPDLLGTNWFLSLPILWLICCVVGNVFVGIPTFYRMQKRRDTHLGICLYELMQWAIAYSFIITAVLCFLLEGGSTGFGTFFVMIIVFTALLALPLTLGGVIYWYLAVRTKEGARFALTLLLSLFLLWNFLIYIFISFAGAISGIA